MGATDFLYALAAILLGLAVVAIAQVPALGIPMSVQFPLTAGGLTLFAAGVADLVSIIRPSTPPTQVPK